MNGKEVTSLLDKSVMDISFFLSNSDWSKYPEVYILDGITSNIFHLNLGPEKRGAEKLINKIQIQIPIGLGVRPFAQLFWFNGKEFYIELSPDDTFQSSIDFYKKAGEFIGVFDLEGNFKYRFLNYPICSQKHFGDWGCISCSTRACQSRLLQKSVFPKWRC